MLRDFVSRAEAYGIDYNIVEALDQPWKIFEGSVGPYWGLFDASRHPKFAGPVRSPIPIIGSWRHRGSCSSVLLSLPILAMSGVTGRRRVLAGAAQCGRRLVRGRVRLSGTAIILCPARPSRSDSACCC